MNKVDSMVKFSWRHLPTLLTFCRIIIIPLLVLVYYLPGGHIVATALFILACLTDWFDGCLARAMNLSTQFGAFLDPVADKLLIVVVLVVVMGSIPYLAFPAAIIIGREIVVSALREWMAELGNRASVAVTNVAKIKTAVQMVALIFLLASRPDHYDWVMISAYALIYIAASLTLWTMIIYIKLSWRYFKKYM